MLCPSPGCQTRVRVITSKSKSESSPQSPSPSHHLCQNPSPRVRVKNNISSPSHDSSSPHNLFNICLSSKTWKQTTKYIECQIKQRNTARHSGLEPESRVTIKVRQKTGLESHSTAIMKYGAKHIKFMLINCIFYKNLQYVW